MYRPLAFISAAALVLALAPWPYGYFQILRFVVCAVAGYGAYFAFRAELKGWGWGLALIAILFNPLIPIYFSRSVWRVLDIATAIVLGYSTRAVRD